MITGKPRAAPSRIGGKPCRRRIEEGKRSRRKGGARPRPSVEPVRLNVMVRVHLDAEIFARVDALAVVLVPRDAKPTRSVALRAVIRRGIATLEAHRAGGAS